MSRRSAASSISAPGVRGVWQRHALENIKKRPKALGGQDGAGRAGRPPRPNLAAFEKAIRMLNPWRISPVNARAIAVPRTPFYALHAEGAGRIYQQTLIDTHAKVAFAKFHDRKTSTTAAESLNDRVIPCFDEHRDPARRC